MLVIDGSFGEGGGQILRTSLSLAALTGTQVTIENIRARREKPGLRPQHLTGALAVAEICEADLQGAEVGSTRLVFRPGKIRPGTYEFDVSRIQASAGSVTLILQTVLWPLAFAGHASKLTIRGGTHVPFAPTVNYIEEVFLPTVERMGLKCRCRMESAGYYPIGGGKLRVDISPAEKLRPLTLVERSEPMNVEVTSAVSNLPRHIAQRQLNTGLARLKSLGVGAAGETVEYPSPGKGTLFFILASFGGARAGFQSLGEIGKRAEKVAQDACEEFEGYLKPGAALDKHLADQLIIPTALADGPSMFTTCEVTQHLLTNIAVVERFLDVRFEVTGELGRPGTVRRLR